MPDERLYLFNPEWQPVAVVGDYVSLIRETGVRIYMRLEFIGALPLLGAVDFGTVANGATSTAARALISSTDILVVGPDEFLQTRMQLDRRDFGGLNPDADASIQVFQPGPADARWATLNQIGRWDITAQDMWTSLHPTELFSYHDQTPMFTVTNNSGSSMTTTRVNFYAYRYLGEVLAAAPERSDVVQTRAGVIVQIPVGPRRGRTSAFVPNP